VADELLTNLKKAIQEFDSDGAASLAKQAVAQKLDPIKILNVLTDAIREVGDAFTRGDAFIPELMGAAEALECAMPIIEEEIKRTGVTRESLGIVVMGTVFGDVHTIGKAMVMSLLTAAGFEVRDLGIDVPTEKFVEAVRTMKPQILGMSALLSNTAPETRKVIVALKEAGLRADVKIMVGGGAITADYAKMVEADGYAATASEAAGLAKNLLGL
jgi:methanogenic corrinoid protein MtbC1